MRQSHPRQSRINKILLVCAILIAVLLFIQFDLHKTLSLANLKARQAEFQAYYHERPVATLGAFMLLYIIVTALSLPGAAILTLAGGALFGFVAGTLSVSFASTIGGTLAFLSSRFLLRDWVQRRFGDKLETVNRGIETEGAFYLFTMRLIVVFPFFVVNALMGLTRMPTLTFYWVSQIGMLPATMAYVYAGREIGKISSAKDILSPGLILSFALLGLFPILTKKALEAWNRRRQTKTCPPPLTPRKSFSLSSRRPRRNSDP